MPISETPPLPRSDLAAVLRGTSYEAAGKKEAAAYTGIGTAVMDVLRDIGTANRMARDKFDGDSAIMHTLKGFVSTGVGAGLEKSMDFIWDKIWQGEIPYYDKSKFGEGMSESLNKFARSSDLNARLYYLIKESTEDLTLGIFYNFLAFRSQPLLEKAKSQHLIGSLVANTIAAATLPSLPKEMKHAAKESSNALTEKKREKVQEQLDQAMRGGYFNKEGGGYVYPDPKDHNKRVKKIRGELEKLTLVKGFPAVKNRGKTEQFFFNVFNLSNPVTQLGVDMIGSGIATLIKNFREVRTIRHEKGGLPGKNVFVPRKEDYRRMGWDRRKEEGKPETKKVYFGQSKQDDLKRLEVYDLKGGI